MFFVIAATVRRIESTDMGAKLKMCVEQDLRAASCIRRCGREISTKGAGGGRKLSLGGEALGA